MQALKFGVFALASCATVAVLSLPSRAVLAEGSRHHQAANDGGAIVLNALRPPTQALTDFKVEKTPPDPDPPLRERKQWVFDLKYERGDIFYLASHEMDLGAPQPTARVMGRFALELFEGPTLIERVRFDFPMLGAGVEVRDAGFFAAPSFERKLTTRIGVMFPKTSHGTRLELYDRATKVRYPMPWPPQDADFAASQDASSTSAPTAATLDASP